MRGSPSASRISLGAGRDHLGRWPAPRSRRRRSRSGTPRRGPSGRRAGRPGRGGSCGRPAGGPAGRSSAAPPGSWKPTRSAPSSPSSSWRRHGQLLEELGRRERDVQVEADPQVGTELAQHLRAPAAAGSRAPTPVASSFASSAALLGEPLVDRDVGVPPLPVELRLGDQVVVERPQRAVGEALVVAPRSPRPSSTSGHSSRPSSSNGSRSVLGAAGPADPGAVVGAHHRLDRGDQPARRAAPAGAAVGLLDPVDGQPVRDDDQVVARARGCQARLTSESAGAACRAGPTSVVGLAGSCGKPVVPSVFIP